MTDDSDGRRHAARARSFGPIARAYAAHRPGYPDAALDWVLAPVAGRADPELLDLAAGTGKLAAALTRRSARVLAVEPDAEMLAVLVDQLPGVDARSGTAEGIPLPAESVDAVLVGQAFHWFDGPAATAEIARVLRPGGAVGLLWNHEDREVGWVREYYAAAGWERYATTAREQPALTASAGFTPVRRRVFDHPLTMTVEGLLANLRTFSWMATLPGAERERRVAAARAYLVGRPETAGGEFVLPLRTTVLRAERR